MAKLLKIHEQLRDTIFVQEHTIAVYFGISRYDKVMRRDSSGNLKQALDDLGSTKEDCDRLRTCLEQYGINSPELVYRLDDNPTYL